MTEEKARHRVWDMDIHHVIKASKSLRLDFRWESLENTKKRTLNNSVKGLWTFVKLNSEENEGGQITNQLKCT